MMVHDISHDKLAGSDLTTPATTAQLARQQAIQQIQRRRRFWISTITWAVIMFLVVVSWAFSEYHNTGGQPTGGFTMSSWPSRTGHAGQFSLFRAL